MSDSISPLTSRSLTSQLRDEAEVVVDCGEDHVGGVTGAALEIAAAEMALVLHVADHRLDRGAATEFALGPRCRQILFV